MLDFSVLIIMKLCQVVTGVKEAKYPSLNYQRCYLVILMTTMMIMRMMMMKTVMIRNMMFC